MNPISTWMDGSIISSEKAVLPITSVAVKYGGSVFEGIRGYWDGVRETLNFVSVAEHVERLYASARLMKMEIAYTPEVLIQAIIALAKASGIREDCYLRGMVSLSGNGLLDSTGPTCVFLQIFPWGRKAVYTTGAHLSISSWRRIDDNTLSPRIKCVSNYQNSRLAVIAAKQDGYDDVLFLNQAGFVAESSVAALFYVGEGVLRTPMLSEGLLESITRRHILQLARMAGIPVVEEHVLRTQLYLAEECFLGGTSLEIVPVLSVDRYPIATLRSESLTLGLQRQYEAFVRGNIAEMAPCLTMVPIGPS